MAKKLEMYPSVSTKPEDQPADFGKPNSDGSYNVPAPSDVLNPTFRRMSDDHSKDDLYQRGHRKIQQFEKEIQAEEQANLKRKGKNRG